MFRWWPSQREGISFWCPCLHVGYVDISSIEKSLDSPVTYIVETVNLLHIYYILHSYYILNIYYTITIWSKRKQTWKNLILKGHKIGLIKAVGDAWMLGWDNPVTHAFNRFFLLHIWGHHLLLLNQIDSLSWSVHLHPWVVVRAVHLLLLYFAFAVGFGEKAELGALVTLGCLKNSIALLVSLRKPWRRRFNALLCHFSKVCSTYIQYLLRNDNKFNAQNGWKWNINIWQTT